MAAVAVSLALAASGCDGAGSARDEGALDASRPMGDMTVDEGPSPADARPSGGDGGATTDASAPPDDAASVGDLGVVDDTADCDPLVPEVCALPWPSDKYLVVDPSTPTGKRLRFGPSTLPRNSAGRHPDPALYARHDGYGVGTPIVVHFPDLDPSGLPDENALSASLAADAQVVLFESRDGALTRIPYFVDVDRRAASGEPTLLFVRPAVLLREGTRYVVAFRNLRRLDGAPLAASPAFAALRDGTAAEHPALAPRVAELERVFADLAAAGVERGTLNLAWAFHTSSCEALHGPLLKMRADALQRLADAPPEIVFDDVRELAPADEPDVALEIDGHVALPGYLEALGPFLGWTGTQLHRDADGQPAFNGPRDVPFRLRVPRGALDGTPHGILAFGHGLNGAVDQVGRNGNEVLMRDGRYVAWAWNMAGMTHDDVPGLLVILTDLGLAPWLTDRLQQGVLDGVMLARVFRDQLGARLADRGVVLDPTRLAYAGHSQGGIYGATVVALSPDLQRGWLGVPGANYSTLLERSVDFTPFMLGLRGTYARRADQVVGLAALQILWDAVDPVSHYRHLSAEPFEGDAPNAVLGGLARGDWQVSPLTMETVARSGVGVPLMAPYDDQRMPPLAETATYPRLGSGITNWIMGGEWPPPGNETPPELEAGDPHGRPRAQPDHQRQALHFFETGELIDVCGGRTCPAPQDPNTVR